MFSRYNLKIKLNQKNKKIKERLLKTKQYKARFYTNQKTG